MTEFQKARAWRESLNLTQEALGELTGYSREAIYWFELGTTPTRSGKKSGKIKPWVWLRYKRACQAVDAELRLQAKFEWSAP